MKRAWKWVAALVGIPALCVVAFWIDATSRAEAAIRAEEERLAKDIAAFRARKKPPFPVPEMVPPGELPCLAILWRHPEPLRIEEGRRWQERLEGFIAQEELARNPPGFGRRFKPPTMLTIEQAIFALAVTQETLGERGYRGAVQATNYDEDALMSLSRPLTRAEIPVSQIRTLADALDGMMAGRRTVEETVEMEYLLDRTEVLRVVRLSSDPTSFLTRRPGWRELFSWRILIAKGLKELDDQYRTPAKPDAPLTRSALGADAAGILRREREVLAVWIVARAATAAALYEREHGRLPTSLKELPELPTTALGGRPLLLEGEKLRVPASSDLRELVWPLRRE